MLIWSRREGDCIVPQPALVQPLRRWDPEQVGGFVILGRLGAGAMGQVYLGRSAAGRLVAVKTIKSELAEEPDFRTRFGQEVAAARRVSGAFTAAVVAADSEADVPWLATVYVPAPSLSRLVRTSGPIPVAAVRWLAAGCAEALESIHSVGLVHRDLKPSNVLVSPDGPRVIDFGVARAAERIQLTVTRGSVGTPAYMAPEQARDTRQATSASDIFSLGATMLFAATSHAPYQGETVVDVLVRLATEPPDLSGLPAELTEIVAACLERDPRNRPTSASVLARLAPGLAASGEPGAAPLPPAALTLINEYRHILRTGTGTLAPVTADAEEETIGSRAGPSYDATPGSAPQAGLAPHGLAPSGLPASMPPITDHVGRPWRRIVLAAGSAVAAAALVAAGWGIGADVESRKPPSAGSGAQPSLGPVLPPPPGQGVPGAPNQAAANGAPYIALNQDFGDKNTGFAVHGQNWPPNRPLTIALVGIGVSPIHPLADNRGNFTYVINQDHEYFRGGLRPGIYTVRVTDSAGASSEARFSVSPA